MTDDDVAICDALGLDVDEARRAWREWDRELVDDLGLDLGLRRPEYLTKQEAADVARVSLSTVERAIRRGELRAGGSPRRVLIKPEWIDEWIAARSRRA